MDYFKNNAPEKMRNISLRAENLTEYGIDIYENLTPTLDELLKDKKYSYSDIKSIF